MNNDSATYNPEVERQHAMNAAMVIKEQIGKKAFVMIGADTFVCGTDEAGPYLRFRFKGSRKANVVKVTLTAADLYNLEFWSVRGVREPKLVSEAEGVYAGDLNRTIEAKTGLYLSL